MRVFSKSAFALLLGFVFTPCAFAQPAWLSNEESINAFRSQVESLKPAVSKYAHVRAVDLQVPLEGRQIAIRVYDSDDRKPKPTIVYVHGACWVAGSLESHDEISRYLASESGAKVIAIDYRLAPEHAYPSGHNDVFESTVWLWDHARELGIDKSKFAIGGESAGAYFAAATVLRSIDNSNSPQFAFLLTVYAALDGGGSSWTECKDNYFALEEDSRSRYGSPLWADNLAGMPPTYSIFAELEISRAEQELFVHKLREQAVDAHAYMHAGVGHDVVNWARVDGDLTAHKQAIKFINAGFGDAERPD